MPYSGGFVDVDKMETVYDGTQWGGQKIINS